MNPLLINIANAAQVQAKTSGFGNSILSWVVGIAAVIVIIITLVLLIRDFISWAKGSGQVSAWSVVAKAFVGLIAIGLIFVLMNYESIGKNFGEIGDKAVTAVSSEVSGAVGAP